jgi:hypothetical protein
MASLSKVLTAILAGTADANIRFGDVRRLLRQLGLQERSRGDQSIARKESRRSLSFNRSPGGKAKPYQVEQVRQVITRYQLRLSD